MSTVFIIFIISIFLLLYFIYLCFKFPSKSRSAKRLRTIFIIASLITAIITGLMKFGPRGKNSLFGIAGIGENKGSDDRQTYSDGKDMEEGSEGFSIIVSGNTVYVGNRQYEVTNDGDGGLSDFISNQDLFEKEITLVDSYALSGTYRYIKELLEGSGAIIIEEAE